MRLNYYFDKGMMPTAERNDSAPIPLTSFAFGPSTLLAQGQWAEIYRMAYERTIAALKPTWYDRAKRFSDN